MKAVDQPELLPRENDVSAQELGVAVARVQARGRQVQRRRARRVRVAHHLGLPADGVHVVEGVVVVLAALQQRRARVEQRASVEVVPAVVQ